MTLAAKLAVLSDLNVAQGEYVDRWAHWADVFMKLEPLFLRTSVEMMALREALLAGEVTLEQSVDRMSEELRKFWSDAKLIDPTSVYYVDKVMDGG